MNKKELTNYIAAKSGFSKKDSEKALKIVLDGFKHALKSTGSVRLVGFGSFTAKKREASTGRNPRTGEAIKIPSSIQVRFRPGEDLKKGVNSKK